MGGVVSARPSHARGGARRSGPFRLRWHRCEAHYRPRTGSRTPPGPTPPARSRAGRDLAWIVTTCIVAVLVLFASHAFQGIVDWAGNLSDRDLNGLIGLLIVVPAGRRGVRRPALPRRPGRPGHALPPLLPRPADRPAQPAVPRRRLRSDAQADPAHQRADRRAVRRSGGLPGHQLGPRSRRRRPGDDRGRLQAGGGGRTRGPGGPLRRRPVRAVLPRRVHRRRRPSGWPSACSRRSRLRSTSASRRSGCRPPSASPSPRSAAPAPTRCSATPTPPCSRPSSSARAATPCSTGPCATRSPRPPPSAGSGPRWRTASSASTTSPSCRSGRSGSSASRPCCAGTSPPGGWSTPTSSCPPWRRPASSSRSARG